MAVFFDISACIDECKARIFPKDFSIMSIACTSRDGVCNGLSRFHQAVKQGRFSHIGSSHENNSGAFHRFYTRGTREVFFVQCLAICIRRARNIFFPKKRSISFRADWPSIRMAFPFFPSKMARCEGLSTSNIA